MIRKFAEYTEGVLTTWAVTKIVFTIYQNCTATRLQKMM